MQYELVDPLDHRELLKECLEVGRQRLGSCRLSKALKTLKLYKTRLLVAARDERGVAGFKLGFAERPGIFHSWLGAVAEDREGQGIGRRLMELQHQHLTEQGYHLVRTGTRNQFKRMLILNLLNGFELVGIRYKKVGPHLQLEKRLSPVAKSPGSNPEQP
jgi:GNAT superfamily N-acetyltransferase